MFVKKDLRKIPQIMEEAAVPEATRNDEMNPPAKRIKTEAPLDSLLLGRRKQEFEGNVKVLCQPKYVPKWGELKTLNLYDCAISNLDGIGLFKDSKLEVLNLGSNPLSSLPDEVAQLSGSLNQLWLEDCQLAGHLPSCILKLKNLEMLRMSRNKITEIPLDIDQLLPKLSTLNLDKNEISSLPTQLSQLPNLSMLFLRGNKLTELPGAMFGSTRSPSPLAKSLKMLHVSSNQLRGLPDSIDNCRQLTHIYANSNQLIGLPEFSDVGMLRRVVVSHNLISTLPAGFCQVFGDIDLESGKCNIQNQNGKECEVILFPNPLEDAIKAGDGPSEDAAEPAAMSIVPEPGIQQAC